MQASRSHRHQERSSFWPVLLIGLGGIWLLAELGALPDASVTVLLQLWPLLLIAIALDFFFGRSFSQAGTVIALATLTLLLVLMYLVPALGNSMAVKTERFSEPLGQATSASIDLKLASAPSEITALAHSANLIDARLQHFGTIDFVVQGEEAKEISLSERHSPFNSRELRWDIGLSPEVPLELRVQVGSGPALLALDELQLTGLVLAGGSGPAGISLPTGEYDVQLLGNSGNIRMDVPSGAQFTFEGRTASGSLFLNLSEEVNAEITLSTGSGSAIVSVPRAAAVRLEVLRSGSGNINIPPEMLQLSQGVWETQGFEEAVSRVAIVVAEMGSGSVSIRQR